MPEFSYRNFNLGKQFIKEYRDCKRELKGGERYKCEVGIRMKYRNVESGRLSIMADKIHGFISHLDNDEIVKLKKELPNLVKIANEYAVVEELMKF